MISHEPAIKNKGGYLNDYTKFIQDYGEANILAATQPVDWNPPRTVKHFVLQPLDEKAIHDFLLSRKQELKNPVDDYEERCEKHLAKVLSREQPQEILEGVKRVMSNPMDLTIVAMMLAQGKEPDLFHLVEQQFEMVKEDYTNIYKTDFPLLRFSERIYQDQLNDIKTLPHEEFANEINLLEKSKMAFSRKSKDGTLWYFRHDKIRDFFIVQTFLGTGNDRPKEHFEDSRFRGVYFLLAILMPEEEAMSLRELLIQHAADTKDHTVSDSFVQIMRTRKAKEKAGWK